MPNKTARPDVIAKALALRETGYTALAISQRLNISVRTLQRHFAATGTRKGAVKAAVYQKARDDLLDSVTSETSIKEEAARLLADDLAHARHIRELIHAASLQMTAGSLADAVLVMRGAAAYSTAVKNTSDIIRHGLRLERFRDDQGEEMPELVVRELTEEQITELRDSHQRQDENSAFGIGMDNTDAGKDVSGSGSGSADDDQDLEVIDES
jgi:AraC-like DNA-binding protein